MSLQWDAEFQEAMKPVLAAQAANPPPPMTDPLVMRKAVNPGLEHLLGLIPEVPGIGHEVHHASASDGYSIAVHRFFKEGVDKTTPALVHIHGGGTVMGNVDMHVRYLKKFASESGLQIFSVEYRLADRKSVV